MTTLPIRRIGDPGLRTPCADVDTFDAALRKLVEDMFQTMYDAPGVGLAANQVGVSLRVFVYDDGQESLSSKGVVANPVIRWTDGEQEGEEGCLSIPGIWHATPRALTVRLEGLDLSGKPVSLDAEGLLARIFQHETDHLNGRLFIDRLPEHERRQVMAELRDRELAEGGGGRFFRSRR